VRALKSPAGQNQLIASLPGKDRRRLLASCDQVELTLADVLWEPGTRIRHVFFPIDMCISQLLPVNGRTGLELALVGSEGMLGVPLVLGTNVSLLGAVVRSSGTALRLSAASFSREYYLSAHLQRSLNRYIYVLMAQLARSAACMNFHVLDARLARWLLMTQDRVHSNEFHLTHELLAKMLGVRRVGITNAAGLLQKRRLVRYSRGEITVLDRIGLEGASCACYEDAKQVYSRAFAKGQRKVRKYSEPLSRPL
jgi:CRP-like cAMP-binding protein